MTTQIEALFTPAEFSALQTRDLSDTACVVFDVLRATSTIVTALANGADAVIPVAEIADALEVRRQHPEVLLAGERDGTRIRANQTGGIDFDLGNSPREFAAANIRGKTIVISTTNGSRALRACAHAQTALVGSFLNLSATSDWLHRRPAARILMVCSGTGDEAAYEDVLGAGALAELLTQKIPRSNISDSTNMALQIFRKHSENLMGAIEFSKNGRRLLAMPELRDDVPFCLQRDIFPIVAKLHNDSIVKAN